MVDVSGLSSVAHPRPAALRQDNEPLPAPPGRLSRVTAFAAAEKHSRNVRLLRKAIPIICIIAVLGAVAGRFFNPFKVTVPDVAIKSVGLEGSKLTMEMPKLSGFKKDAKAYEVTADAAVQDIKKSNIVELKVPIARIEMDRGNWARLTADYGIYNSTTEKLDVKDKVGVKTDNGLVMRMSVANIDLKAGTVLSDAHTEVDLPNGWITADRMQVLENGHRIVFEGNVKSEFKDNEPQENSAAPKEIGKVPDASR